MKRQSGVTMPTELWLYVDDLLATGLYGDSLSGVVRGLVAKGVQDAVAGRIIPVRTFTLTKGRAHD